MTQSTLAFDIEVAGRPWEEVDEPTREYLERRARDDEDREALPERTGLLPGLGQVVAIGVWSVEADRGLVLLEGDLEDQRPWERFEGAEVFRGTERDLLEKFWDIVERRRPRLVSYNGRCFDGPVLMIRSAQLGVRPTAQLVPNRYDVSQHCDLLDVLSFMGAWRERFSLDYWCRRFDVESPKGALDGSQVTGAYREGRLEEIGEYCLRDVRATARLFERVRETILPLFRGGG